MPDRQSISFCLSTRGPAARVHALLALVRPHVDEIVLAVDDRTGPATLDACAQLADVRLSFQYVAPPCSHAAWLQHQCGADWILRFDDDEIPSAALLAALPRLSADRQVTHYGLTRRWLYRDPRTYLLSPPWLPDYQPRLMRNVRSLWSFGGRLHDGAVVLGEGRLVDLPIYHADLLLLDVDERRRKAERNERLRPDHLLEGTSVNAIYVPEEWDGLTCDEVPRADAELIEGVLAAPAPPAPAGETRSAVRHAARPEIERLNTTREVSAAAYEARIEFVRPLTKIRAGVVRTQEIVVANLGDERWPPGYEAQPVIRMGHRWRRAGDADAVPAEGRRTAFTETVEPGARTRVRLGLEAPRAPGRYVLEVDVVHERVRWFGCPAWLEVEVFDDAAEAVAELAGRRGYVAQARRHGLPAAKALADYGRWSASLAADRTPLGDRRPWLTFAAQRALDEALEPGMVACEWGAGGSTRYLLDRVAALTTIECSPDAAAAVGAAVRAKRRSAWTLAVVEPEPAAGSESADPSDPEAYVSAARAFRGLSFRAYAAAIDGCDGDGFDLVLVAGRARPSCLRHALTRTKPGGFVVLDHAERPWYGAALRSAEDSGWAREDHAGPGPYAERFWRTTILRRPS